MSEEIQHKGYATSGRKLGPYQFYNIGATTLDQLKTYKIVPDKNYGKFGKGKPDALLVDRRNRDNIRVIAVIEHKQDGAFLVEAEKTKATEQCNDLAQVLGAEVGLATDGTSVVWFNPWHALDENSYTDRFGEIRSYSRISDAEGQEYSLPFSINEDADQPNYANLSGPTRATLDGVNKVIESISINCSQITEPTAVDPTSLAKQIWQDVWSVSGATPERCLYTFVELFIFKYLSDLGVLNEDENGNKVTFAHILSLDSSKAFKNYSQNARPHLKKMFPADAEDGTTIINGTVLNPAVSEHGVVFHKLLKKFDSYGPLRTIDPAFKSRVFEEFMKQSNSKKNWGQYFTPRNIIDAMIQMSDIEMLDVGSEVCDPACGVGGFILEPIKLKSKGLDYYYQINGNKITSRLNFTGFDKGFEKEEQLTIILAKANYLIFVSELLTKNPTLSKSFAALFNRSFSLLSKSILGTLEFTERDKYDLILTNPPYVTSGSSNYKEAIRKNAALRSFYTVSGIGVEGLFLEWIVRSLKPGKKALVVIPDGVLHRLHDHKLRSFIKEQCFVDALISLPVNAFYQTPKKTYIAILTKKSERTDQARASNTQEHPVFTYLVSTIGETLDVNRFATPHLNDLPDAVAQFNQFKGAKGSYIPNSARCKVQPIVKFDPKSSWAVDRWWTEEERIELGIEDEKVVVSIDEFVDQVESMKAEIDQLIVSIKQVDGVANAD